MKKYLSVLLIVAMCLTFAVSCSSKNSGNGRGGNGGDKAGAVAWLDEVQVDEKMMEMIMNDPDEKRARVYDYPTSSIREDGKRINYYRFITSLKDKDCNAALKRIVPKINLKEIFALVEKGAHNINFVTPSHYTKRLA